MSHCILHLLGDIMFQLMHPPWRHFVPHSQFESPYPGQSLRVTGAYLGYILGSFWPYLRQSAYIKENHWSTDIFQATNCPIRQNVPLSSRRQNFPTYGLMHRKVAGKLLGHFVGCPTLSIWKPIPRAKVARTCIGHILATSFSLATNCPNNPFGWQQNVPTTFHNFPVYQCISWDILSPGRKWEILSSWLGQFVAWKC